MIRTINAAIGICVTLLFTGCDTFRIITATNHKPKIETEESINRFTHKLRIDGYPIMCLDTSFQSYEIISLKPLTFNAAGKYLDMEQKISGCPDDKAFYIAFRYILEHGDDTFVTDSLTEKFQTLRDPNQAEYIFEAMKKERNVRKDSSLWEYHTETYPINFRTISPYLRNLNGGTVDVNSIYENYVTFQLFVTYGKSNYTGIMVRSLIKDIKKLNKDFDHHVQIVLIYDGDLDWKKSTSN